MQSIENTVYKVLLVVSPMKIVTSVKSVILLITDMLPVSCVPGTVLEGGSPNVKEFRVLCPDTVLKPFFSSGQ